MANTIEALIEEAGRLAASGDRPAAIAQVKKALRSEPGSFRGWLMLSRFLYEDGEVAAAVSANQKMERFDPLSGDFQRIQQAIQARRLDEARGVAEVMLKHYPGHPRAVFTLAHLARARGDFEAAIAVLEEGLRHGPANPVLRDLLVSTLEDEGQYARAIEAARQLAALQENFDTVQRLLGLLLRYGLNEEALAACERAARLANGDRVKLSQVELARGQLQRILGRREAAVAALRASLDANHQNASAWWGLADLKTFDFSEADQEAMAELLLSPSADRVSRCQAAFALARASEAQGDPARSMAWYDKANSFYPGERFDPAQFNRAVERVRQGFDRRALAAQAAPVPRGPVPIFILGLPRSGSTLVEQMLASHPAIEGTMELPVLPAVKRRAHKHCVEQSGGDYLDKIAELSPAALAQLGQSYIDETAVFRSQGARYFTDKLPHNFEHVGLIHKILPQAIIIDIRRNPLDCGLSLYKQYFAQGVGYSYDQASIGTYYNGYLSLMDHWNDVLPERVFHLAYEDLVVDPESHVPSLLEHIGVEFEPACLSFHENARAVRTASSEQVRQPLNRGGIGQWRKVEPFLVRLKESLGQETLKRFEGCPD